MTLMPETYANQTFFLTLKEAAHELRCSSRTVLRAIERGHIRGRKAGGGKWIINRRSILAYGLGYGPRLSATERKELQELTS